MDSITSICLNHLWAYNVYSSLVQENRYMRFHTSFPGAIKWHRGFLQAVCDSPFRPYDRKELPSKFPTRVPYESSPRFHEQSYWLKPADVVLQLKSNSFWAICRQVFLNVIGLLVFGGFKSSWLFSVRNWCFVYRFFIKELCTESLCSFCILVCTKSIAQPSFILAVIASEHLWWHG